MSMGCDMHADPVVVPQPVKMRAASVRQMGSRNTVSYCLWLSFELNVSSYILLIIIPMLFRFFKHPNENNSKTDLCSYSYGIKQGRNCGRIVSMTERKVHEGEWSYTCGYKSCQDNGCCVAIQLFMLRRIWGPGRVTWPLHLIFRVW